MGGHAADARTTTRANRGLSRCRGPSGTTCREMPGASGELNAGLKKIGTIMNLSSGADTHKSESLIPQLSRGHQPPAQSLSVIVQRGDHASWAAEAARTGTDWRSLTAAVLEVLVSASIIRLEQSTIEFRAGCEHRRRPRLAHRQAAGKRADEYCTRRHQRRPRRPAMAAI